MRNVEVLKFYISIVREESELREGRDSCICIALTELLYIHAIQCCQSRASPQILNPLHMGEEFYLGCRNRI